MNAGTSDAIRQRLLDSLYVEAMLLADEARSYFDVEGRVDRDRLAPLAQVGFSCESLKVTTRLLHVIAWLLTQRAVDAGEIAWRDALDPSRRIGDPPPFDPDLVAVLPARAKAMIDASADLYRRVARLDQAQEQPPIASPARSLHARLATAF